MDKRLEAAGIEPDLRAIVDVLNQGVVGGARDDKARSVLQAEIEERRQKGSGVLAEVGDGGCGQRLELLPQCLIK